MQQHLVTGAHGILQIRRLKGKWKMRPSTGLAHFECARHQLGRRGTREQKTLCAIATIARTIERSRATFCFTRGGVPGPGAARSARNERSTLSVSTGKDCRY